MAQFYGYRGYIGVEGLQKDLDLAELEGQQIKIEDLSEALINNPLDEGQLGFVCDMSKCYFNDEAIRVLKKVNKGNDDLGEIDIFAADDGVNVIAWLGGPMTIISDETEGSNSYDPALLDKIITVELEVPEGLAQYIDAMIDDAPEYTGNDE